MITSYSDYLVQVMRLIDGDDVTVSDLATDTLKQIVGLAQRRIYRQVRSRFNERAFASTVTTTDNLAALPLDFEAVSIIHFGGKALTPVTEEFLREYLDSNPTGDACYFASVGSNLQFGPAVADGTIVQGRYFCRFDELSAANFGDNALVAREPDLFIYAAVVEAIPFFPGAANQAQMFMAKYEQIKDAVNADTRNVAINAGRLVRNNSARLTG